MQRTTSLQFDDDIEQLAATPSGDRVFVVTKTGTTVDIVDRFREEISGKIDLGRPVADLRIDPLGRYLLAHPDGADSVLVIALGTNRVIGAVATSWRDDLPLILNDGSVAIAQGADVEFIDAETLNVKSRVKDGAADFWYAFRWNGFRPRDARLDKPADFNGDSAGTRTPDSSAATRTDSVPPSAAPALPAPARDTTPRRPVQYTVSFAALLAQDKARELAATIKVGNEAARVVTAQRDGSTIYRVVLGPYATREEADRIGRDSHQSYWIYEGGP
jgi:hypothetical protein